MKKTLTKSVVVVDNISNLPPKPLISAALLQGLFDKSVADDKTFANALIDELQNETLNTSGSFGIGHNSPTIVAKNVGDALIEVVGNVNTLDTRYYTETELNAGQLDTRYYTETELNVGQLDTRYYTEAETGTIFATKAENALKANTTDVYSKADLDPFLRGGDTLIKYEVFTIVNSNLGNGTFSYLNKNAVTVIGTLDGSGNQVFTLIEGNYLIGQNRINMTINDTLQRSVASGGLLEVDATHIALTSPEGAGAELTIQYFERIGIVGTGLIVQGTVKPPSEFFWYKEV